MNTNPLAGIPNPFRQTIVRDAWETLEDVSEIHAQAFETCCRAFENVRTFRHCDSVLLHGEAGSGKTHLLSRLQRHWTSSPGQDGSKEMGRCVFLYCRLQTSAQKLWQHLRRTFVEDLLHRFPDGTTQLQRLVACRFAEGDKNKRRPPEKWLKWIKHPANRDHSGWKRILLPWLGRETQLGFSLQRVLHHLITGRHVLEAGAWLKGEDRLPEEALNLMGIRGNEEGQTEDGAREIVLSLCRLASTLMPVGFCFDQIEALQTSKSDEESLFLFGQMGASLFNSSNNALLISCIQSSVLDQFRGSIRDADYDRIAQRVERLDPLDRRLAPLLIRSRLESGKELAILRARHPQKPLWPLEPPDLDAVFSPIGTQTARRIISFAGDLFDRLQTGQAPPPRDPLEFLREEFDRRLNTALGQDEEESDLTLAHGLPLLAEVLGEPWDKKRQPDKDIDLLLSHADKRVAVSLCNQQNMRSLGARLKRLKDWHARNRGVKLVMVRDQRLPISRSAVVTRSHLQSLRGKGAVLIHPDPVTMAALQALRTLLSDAMSGDLHDGRDSVGTPTVREWLSRNAESQLVAFFGEIVGASEGPSEADSDLMSGVLEVLKRHRIISLDELARESKQPASMIVELAKRHPGRIGWLEGPPPVLFDYRPAEILSSRERDPG
ncbi:MAG: ATP-binding protein [Deltaproteobacteria bacterium]|nr:ATP-binding protein [Deltaproteobacteria bacterium]